MRALLRYQAVLVARMLTVPSVIWVSGCLLLALACSLYFNFRKDSPVDPGFALLGLIPLMAMGTLRTLDLMEGVRRSAPVSPGRVLLSHFAFWGSAWALLGLAGWWLRGLREFDGGWGAILSTTVLGLDICGLAALVQVLRREWTTGRFTMAFLFGWTLLGCLGVTILTWFVGMGTSSLEILAPHAALSVAAGAWIYLRAEGVPAESGTPMAGETGGARGAAMAGGPIGGLRTVGSLGLSAGRGTNPMVTFLRASLSPWWILIWIPLAVWMQLVPKAPSWFHLFWCIFGPFNLVTGACLAWRWLMGSSIPRGRAFAILLAPSFLLLLLCAGIRPLLLETDPKRILPVEEDTSSRGDHPAFRFEGVAAFYDADSGVAPDPRVLADQVGTFLDRWYGRKDAPDRVLGAILDGWPRAESIHDADARTETVRAAIRRVRACLEPEMMRDLRLRGLLDGLLACLAFSLLLRARFAGERRFRWLFAGLLLVVVGPVLILAASDDGGRAVTNAMHGGFQTHAVAWTLVLITAIAVTLQSAVSAFGRLEVVDLPRLGRWGSLTLDQGV